MHFLIWALSVILMAALFASVALKSIKEYYENYILDLNNEHMAKINDHNDLVVRRDKEITNLTLENINLTHENDILKKKLDDLEKKYEIKSTMCMGLQKNARLWHESYEELESHIDEVRERCSNLVTSKETEHQKEIEDLTRYYKEKIQKYTHPVEGGNCQNAD